MGYEELLSRARDKMPEIVMERERFEIPKVKGRVEGQRTVISNFQQIAETLRRDPEHLLKFVLRELAAPGELRRGLLFVRGKISASRINDKIRQYANEFVLCPSCGKPDTELVKEGEFMFLKCAACGNKQPVKSKI